MRQFGNSIWSATRIALIVLSMNALCAYAQDSTDEMNAIQSISATNLQGGKVVIKVGLKKPLEVQPAAFTINTPPRIAFDFPNTANALGKSIQEFAEGDLRSANIVQAGNRTRLVINLNQLLSYDSQLEGNDLLITLQGKASSVSEPISSARFAEAKQLEQKHNLRDVDFRRGKNGEGRIQVDLSDNNVGIDIKQQGKLLIVDFVQAGLPRNLQRKLDVTDFGTPVQILDTFAQGQNTRVVIEPKGVWEYSAYQTDNRFIIEVKALIEDPTKLNKGLPGYSGDKLTLNFQNITTREALNVIADFTNLNIVISDTVSGSLTLRLKDVPWDQALDIILQSRGLDMRKNGNVIQVAPREEIASKEKLELSARQDISEIEVVRTESFQLSYSKAQDVVLLITNATQRMLSKRGSAVADIRTNTLFVQDTASRLDEVRKVIKQIDIPVRQVMIEARFVAAGDSFNRTLGANLNATAPTTTNPPGFTGGTITGSVNLPGAATGTGGLALSFFNATATKTLNLELNASELDGKTKNIASPRVVTGDKLEATISSGVEIPYQQATSSGATNVAFANAVLSLKVTPQITPDNRISMKIAANQDTVGTIYSGVPSINTKKVETQVLVENGGTVVIGGIYTQDISDSVQGVPLLSEIPILGWLFKQDTSTTAKQELLIFITPKILKDSLNLN